MCVVTYTTSPISNNPTSIQSEIRFLLDLVTPVTSRDRHRGPLTCSGRIPAAQYRLPAWGFRSATHVSHASRPQGPKMQQIITCTRKPRGANAASSSTSITEYCGVHAATATRAWEARADVIQGMCPRSGMNGGERTSGGRN